MKSSDSLFKDSNKLGEQSSLSYSSERMELICSILKGVEKAIKSCSQSSDDKNFTSPTESMYENFSRLEITSVEVLKEEVFEHKIMS